MSLSVEVIDHIMSFLQGDSITLDVCSAVFPEEVVDRYLYANITIPGNTQNCYPCPPVFLRFNPENLSITLTKNPRIATYVRNLRISLYGRSAVHRKIPSILSQLSRVESTVLSGYIDVIPWLKLNQRFRTVFVDHLKLPTMEAISIFGIEGFPLSVIDKCKNLRRLSLIGKFKDGSSPSTSPPCSLQHLEVTPQTSPRKFVSWAKMNTLQSLSLNFYNLQYRGTLLFPDILQGFSSTLVNLELKFGYFFSTGPLIPFTLPNLEFPSLQCLLVHTSLVMGFDLDDSRETWFSALPAIIPLLETMANSGPSANTYHLSLHLEFMTTIPRLATPDWPRYIVTLSAIPNVHHPIKLYISCHRGKAPDADLLSAIEQDPKLEQLTKEAKLQIESGPVFFSTLIQ